MLKEMQILIECCDRLNIQYMPVIFLYSKAKGNDIDFDDIIIGRLSDFRLSHKFPKSTKRDLNPAVILIKFPHRN
jgi:hypothetical protein